MQWFKKKSLYNKIMLLAGSLLLLLLGMLAIIWQDALKELPGAVQQGLILKSLAGAAAALLAAERLAVKIAVPFNAFADQAAAISQTSFGIKSEETGACEKERLTVIFSRLAAKLRSLDEECRSMFEEGMLKKQQRDGLISKLIAAQEDERRRISRELHDEIGQALTTLMVSMRALSDRVTDEQQREILLGARELAAQTLNDIRLLAVNLRPPVLDDLGLAPAMNKYLKRFGELHDIQTEFSVHGSSTVSSHTATTLYRIMQESLTNIIKHSGARQVDMHLELSERHVVLKVSDDGCGFTDLQLKERQLDERLGVYGMTERAQLLGGTLQIEGIPGQGTTVMAVLPNQGGKPQ